MDEVKRLRFLKDGSLVEDTRERKKPITPFIDEYLYHINVGEISDCMERGEEILAWCYEHVGKEDNFVSYIHPEDFSLVFAFNDAEDATAFKLKWL